MATDSELLAVLPVRAGSKGVPRKNVAILGGRPMFAHTVQAILDAGIAVRVVISTDDSEVEQWCRLHEIEVHRRSKEASGDGATIATAIQEVVSDLGWQGCVGVFQATSPLRSSASIAQAWALFNERSASSLMSAVRVNHLQWQMRDGKASPLFEGRKNRQDLRAESTYVLSETGAIQFVRREHIKPEGLVGPDHLLFELPEHEALDIDTFDDLEAARRWFGRLLIVFRFTANARVGSGHLRHVLQISELFARTEVEFLLKECDEFAYAAIQDAGYVAHRETSMAANLDGLAQVRNVIVVNDVLDTTEPDLLAQRAAGYKVICIEDLGAGPRYADLVVNALYDPPEHTSTRVVSGPRWATLRTEFVHLPPKDVRKEPEELLVTFGGTDPSRLTQRFVPALAQLGFRVIVVGGAGAKLDLPPLPNVEVVTNVRSMAEAMLRADLVVTSAGRTVYEAAATGTPVVVLAQNAREATHAHLGFDTGTLFLGLGVLNEPDHVAATVNSVMGDYHLRSELSARLRRSLDGHGARRIATEIKRIAEGL